MFNKSHSKKDIKEKILQENPVPSNTKNVEILHEHIKELLLENRTSCSLSHEKVLNWTQ